MLFADRSSQQKAKEFDEITKLFQGDYEYIARISSARCKLILTTWSPTATNSTAVQAGQGITHFS
jgi:hypothetical protein